MLSLEVKAIGNVQELGEGRCLRRLLQTYRDGLHGLRPGNRVQVLYWMHGLAHSQRSILQLHPGGDERQPLRGVFGLRSPARPNPIGVSEVEIVEVRETSLVVTGLDARDGSPIVDLKAACPT
jgi:tRNA-Thr(GGU) m(6)t(6)A37 methyltransferase TsaA